MIEGRQIDGFVLTDEIFGYDHFRYGLSDRFFIGFEQFLCGFYKLFFYSINVTFVGEFI